MMTWRTSCAIYAYRQNIPDQFQIILWNAEQIKPFPLMKLNRINKSFPNRKYMSLCKFCLWLSKYKYIYIYTHTVLKVYLSPQYLPCVRFIVLRVYHWHDSKSHFILSDPEFGERPSDQFTARTTLCKRTISTMGEQHVRCNLTELWQSKAEAAGGHHKESRKCSRDMQPGARLSPVIALETP